MYDKIHYKLKKKNLTIAFWKKHVSIKILNSHQEMLNQEGYSTYLLARKFFFVKYINM